MPTYTLVTGASRGLGLALSQQFAARKKPLVLVARSGHTLDAMAAELSSAHGVPVLSFACDLSTQQGVDALLARCKDLEIEGLINNAGRGLGGPFSAQDPKAISAMLFLNIQALTQLTRHFIPSLIKHRGVLLNVASQAAFQPVPQLAAYAASKAYVLHLTEALHHELLTHNVRVLALCPGATQTEFFNQAGIDTRKTLLTPGPIGAVIDAAMAALKTNRPLVVPGFINKAATFVQRFVSRRLVTKMSARLMQERGHSGPSVDE